jgi:hypothetical protein
LARRRWKSRVDPQAGKRAGCFAVSGWSGYLSRERFDRLKSSPLIKPKLEYERRAIPENKYHGNLLLKKDVPARVMKKIAAGIALCVVFVELTE